MKNNNTLIIGMIKILLLLFITLCLLASCSPTKKLQRIIKNNPELLDTITVVKDSVVIIPSIKDSLVVRDSITIDTQIVTKDSTIIHLQKKNGIVRVDYKSKEKKYIRTISITNTINLSKDTILKIEKEANIKAEKKYKLELLIYKIIITLILMAVLAAIIYAITK